MVAPRCVIVGAWLSAIPTEARAGPTKQECIRANELAQDLVRMDPPDAAVMPLLRCSDQSCPGPVREDCLRMLDELARGGRRPDPTRRPNALPSSPVHGPGETIDLPVTGISIRVPAGRWQLLPPLPPDPKKISVDQLASEEGRQYVVSSSPRPGSCGNWQTNMPPNERPVSSLPRGFEFGTKGTSNGLTKEAYCGPLSHGRVMLVLVTTPDGSTITLSSRQLAEAIGSSMLARYGAPIALSQVPPAPFVARPDTPRTCANDPALCDRPPDFDYRRALRVARGKLGFLAVGGATLEQGFGGTVGVAVTDVWFDRFSTSIADFGFAHGGQIGAGYESHDNFVFEGWYGIGMGFRVWRFGLTLRGGGGFDALGGSKKGGFAPEPRDKPTFKLAFKPDVGLDVRLRGWFHRLVGIEGAFAWWRRLPDSDSDPIHYELRVDGNILVGNPNGFIFSAGPDIRLFGSGLRWFGATTGFGW
jgi:hypothetical protein